MVSGLNVCDELQDLYVNCPMSYFIKGVVLLSLFTALYLLPLKFFRAVFLLIVCLQWVLHRLF